MTFFFMYEYPSNFCLNLIPKPAGEPVFLVFSEHITSWYNNGDECDKEYTQVEVTYPRWKFLPQSSINYIIQGGQILALTEEEKMIKSLALQGEPDPADPNPPAKKKSPVPGPSPQLALPPGPSKPIETPKRKSGTAPKGILCSSQEERQERLGCNNPQCRQQAPKSSSSSGSCVTSEDDLQSAQDRVRRLEDKEDDMKKSYEDAMKKMEETIGDYDDLIELKRATYNHFLSKWENENAKNQGEDITPLKNAFPLTLRKYFLEDIEKDKNSLQ